MEEKDYQILCRLRNNSREKLTKMSRAIRIPVSTIYDRLKKYEGDVIKKHTVLLDFKKMGYDLRVNMLLKVPGDVRAKFQDFLSGEDNVNSLYRVNNGYDFMAETLFKNMREFKDFTDKLIKFGVYDMEEFFVLEDLKREGFMTTGTIFSAS